MVNELCRKQPQGDTEPDAKSRQATARLMRLMRMTVRRLLTYSPVSTEQGAVWLGCASADRCKLVQERHDRNAVTPHGDLQCVEHNQASRVVQARRAATLCLSLAEGYGGPNVLAEATHILHW